MLLTKFDSVIRKSPWILDSVASISSFKRRLSSFVVNVGFEHFSVTIVTFSLSLRYCHLLLLLTLFLRAPVSGGCILPWCPVQCVLHFCPKKLIDWSIDLIVLLYDKICLRSFITENSVDSRFIFVCVFGYESRRHYGMQLTWVDVSHLLWLTVEYKGYIHRVQKVSQNVLKYLVQNLDDYEKMVYSILNKYATK